MGYYLLVYHVVGDYVSKRAPHREEHLRLARSAKERGELILGGALSDPVDRALLVFRVSDPGVIQSFVDSDPYVRNGLIERWEIRPWNVVIE